MKYKKTMAPLFLTAAGLVYLNFFTFRPQITFTPKVLGVATTTPASAATSTPDSNATSTDPTGGLLDKIDSQVQALADQNAALQTTINRMEFLSAFPRTLKRGMSGDDVTALQKTLNSIMDSDSQIPVSGFFE